MTFEKKEFEIGFDDCNVKDCKFYSLKVPKGFDIKKLKVRFFFRKLQGGTLVFFSEKYFFLNTAKKFSQKKNCFFKIEGFISWP